MWEGQIFSPEGTKRPRLMKGFSADRSHFVCSPVYASASRSHLPEPVIPNSQVAHLLWVTEYPNLASSEAFKAAVRDLANINEYAS